MNNKTSDQVCRKTNWELFIFGLFFTAFSLYMSYAVFLSHQKQTDASDNFVPVKAKILLSQVTQTIKSESTSDTNQVYLPDIHYEYVVNGQVYQSKKFNYAGEGFSRSKDATRVIRYYPEGSMQSAYYNPDNPNEAVLHKPTSSKVSLSIFFPALFVLAGFLCIFGGWKGWLRTIAIN
jgi:uncharacterized protein DUF3592